MIGFATMAGFANAPISSIEILKTPVAYFQRVTWFLLTKVAAVVLDKLVVAGLYRRDIIGSVYFLNTVASENSRGEF